MAHLVTTVYKTSSVVYTATARTHTAAIQWLLICDLLSICCGDALSCLALCQHCVTSNSESDNDNGTS